MKKNVSVLILLVCVCCVYVSFGQPNTITLSNDKVREIVEELRNADRVVIGDLALHDEMSVSTDYTMAFSVLSTEANVHDLEQLVNSHPSPTLRCYAFGALLRKDKESIFKILAGRLNDTEQVRVVVGEEIRVMNVADFMINSALPKFTDNYVGTLTIEEVIRLDSMLLYTPNSLQATKRMLQRLIPEENYYERVKTLAIKREPLEALVALARYRNPKDIPIFLANTGSPSTLLQVVNIFPDRAFIPFLTEYGDKYIGNEDIDGVLSPYFNAVAKYQSEWSVNVLSKYLEDDGQRGYNKRVARRIFEAFSKYPCGAYDGLFFLLWKRYYCTSSRVMRYLAERHPVDVQSASVASVRYIVEIWNTVEEDVEDVCDHIVRRATASDMVTTKEALCGSVADADISMLDYLCGKIQDFDDPNMVECLLPRIEREWDKSALLILVRTAIDMNKSVLAEKIGILRKKNEALQHGESAEAVKSLLMANNIKY